MLGFALKQAAPPLHEAAPTRVKQRLLRFAGCVRDPDGNCFYSQTGQDVILAHLPFGHDFDLYVDVGAFRPIKYSNTYYFYQRGWTGIDIEPTSGQIDLFKNLCPRDLNLACAVDRIRGLVRPTTFNDAAVNNADVEMVESAYQFWAISANRRNRRRSLSTG